MLKDFREFIMRGNVLDMAVGVIIGASFGGIVASLVADVLMPPIGLALSGIDFSNIKIPLKAADLAGKGAVEMNIGKFINAIINFVIVAFVIFILVKGVNKMKKAPPPADATTKSCPQCLSTIPLKAVRCAHCTSEIKPA